VEILDKQISLSEKELDLLKSTLNFKKYEIEKEIKDCISELDNSLEKILYYNDLIKVDWCKEAHNVYQENKEEYLARAHKWYSWNMDRLTKRKSELNIIEKLFSKLYS